MKGQQFTYELPAYSLNILRLDVRDVEIVAEEKAELPEPLVQYSFDGGQEADDEGKFPESCTGGAIVAMDDGNKALYTGSNGGQGFFDLGVDMARQTFSGLEGDYTMSVAIALPGVGALDQYCWAYGFSNGTEQYVGLVNSPDNTGWYYTIKDGRARMPHRMGIVLRRVAPHCIRARRETWGGSTWTGAWPVSSK